MRPHRFVFNRLVATLSITLVAFVTALSGDAQASCFTDGNRLTAPLQFSPGAAGGWPEVSDQPGSSIVGLYRAQFLIGDGPDLYDESFQQFHSDGTEMMLSRGLPPVLGNVCVGIWKQTGPRTFKLKHMAWNWNPDNSFAGTFLMEVTIRLSRSGYTGTWKADSFDPSGAVIPDQHFEGVARATRISLE
jgi:hypothetical protein